MKKTATPKNEKVRITALKKLNILDTPSEEQYDNITELAAYICDVPIALIALVDEKRKWIKAKVGVEYCEVPREDSFCAHAILNSDEVLQVPDTRLDHRFKDNPMVTRDEDPILFYVGFPLKGGDGNVLGTLCLMDHRPRQFNEQQLKALKTFGHQVEILFELRLKNNQMRASKKELRKQNTLLKNFAGAVSHDLKMPLSNIIMTIDLLKAKYAEKLDESGFAYLKKLKQSAFGMSDYISNILAYYETENVSSQDYAEKPFGLKEFLESIIDMLNIERNCEINLPDYNFDLICNRSALEQIFLNLLGNSLKYNDKEKTIISIGCEEEEGFYKFELTDNGIGIPKDQQDKVFDLFSVAADKDRHGKKGNGIGLTTVHKLVEKLGGKIAVDSELGKYTTFTFTIEKQQPKTQKTA